MKFLRVTVFFFFLLIFQDVYSQIKLCSWNLENFGKSKSDSSIRFIANTLKEFDLIAVVEVVAGQGGAQAVARLADELNRKGSKWDYCISDPTFGMPNRTERYAFIWKTSQLKKKADAHLEEKYKAEIEREPYLATFISKNKEFTVAAFHALPKDKQPETEIKYFRYIPEEYPDKNIIFCGDFNCPESHTVFNPLKEAGYKASLQHQKTTLKMACKELECLASEYDNIFYRSEKIELLHSGVIPFYKSFHSLKEARVISDHLPVYVEFRLK